MFLTHLNSGVLKCHWDSDQSWIGFTADVLKAFLWIELWAYCAHRFLHLKCLYPHVHKWHHRYTAPTAFSAFAMHPAEFLFYQLGGVTCLCMFEMHFIAFLTVASYTAYHGQVDHSG